MTLPVLVARNENVMTWPTTSAAGPPGLAVLTRLSSGSALTVVVTVEFGEVTAAPPGAVPVASAVLAIEPLSRSACCTV